MLIIKYILISLLPLFTCCSCQREHRYPVSILQVEKIMNTDPDSAASLLASFRDSVWQMPEYVQMYYDLLSVKVKDKCYIVHTSDSVISRVVSYYEKGDDRDKLMEAYHYMGRVYWDLNDMPRALGYYQKAIDASEGTKDYHSLARIYDQLGNLYAYQRVYDEALPMHHKGYYYYQLAGDSLSLPYVIGNIARLYSMTEQKDSAVIYYQRAIDLATSVRSKAAVMDISCELGDTYTDLGKYSLASKYLYQSVDNPMTKDPYISFVCLGYLYVQTHQTDSAYFYLNKCISTNNVYTLLVTYKYLSLLEENNSNFENAVKYNHIYSQWSDSIDKITDSETIRKMSSLYNYQKAERKSNRLMAASQEKQLFIYQLIILLVIAIGGSIVYVLFERNKQKNLKRKQQKHDELKAEQYRKSQAYIDENEQKIKELENQLLLARERTNEEQANFIKTQKEVIDTTNQKIIKQARLIECFKRSDIYQKFQDPLNMDVNKLRDDDWNALQEELNNVYDNFTNRLYALYPQLSLIELRICCLVKISVTVTNMAKLLGRSKSAITAARIRLHYKLRGEAGTVEMLDEFIVKL